MRETVQSRVHPFSRAPGSQKRAAIYEKDSQALAMARRLMNRILALRITDASEDPQCATMHSAY